MRPILSILLIFSAVPSLAHHSSAFYTEELVEVSGELIDVDWRNPHSVFTVRSVDANGEESTWMIEGNSTFNYMRIGITRELFNVGDQVRVMGYVSSLDDRALEGANMLLPGGREVLLWEDQEPRYAGEAILVTGVDETVVDAASENLGFFRVWSSPRGIYWGQQMASQPRNEAAIAAQSSFDMLDNFATRCEGEGMPRIMINPHSFEFEERGDTIALRTELYDTERTIHLDQGEIPSSEPLSMLGYSVGTVDGTQLHIRTERVGWPWFDNRGTPQSEDVVIEELYTLSEDQSRLDFEITVTDPMYLTEPAVLTGYWLALGHELPPYNCQSNR